MRVTARAGMLVIDLLTDRSSRRPTIRWIVTTVVASLAALALLAVPALAGSSFSQAEVPADADIDLTLTITEPDDEAYGDTARVTVVAPSTFTVLGCQPELTWGCTADPDSGTVTFDRTALGALGDDTLQFSVHTAAVNDTYGFAVTQTDGTSEPATARSRPAITVTGGRDPAPEPDDGSDGGDGGDGGTSDDGGSSGGTDGGDSSSTDSGDSSSTDSGTSNTGSDDGTGSSTEATTSDTTGSSSASDGDDEPSDSDGTSPRRTQGRSSGTSLEITPGQPTAAGDQTIDEPAVADDPAVAPPSDGATGEGGDGETPTMTAIAGDAGDEAAGQPGGVPWQQLLGGALLVAGGALVAARRWDLVARVRGWDPMARIRRWRGR